MFQDERGTHMTLSEVLAQPDYEAYRCLTTRGVTLINGVLTLPHQPRLLCEAILACDQKPMGVLKCTAHFGIEAIRFFASSPLYEVDGGKVQPNFTLTAKARQLLSDRGLPESQVTPADYLEESIPGNLRVAEAHVRRALVDMVWVE